MPGKNRQPVAGVPLYERALSGALDAGVFAPVIFSTDDEEIQAALAQREGVLLDRRPAHLAEADVGMWDVLAHVLKTYAAELEDVDAVCCITPCHPFRSAALLREACAAYYASGGTSLVGVTPFPCAPALALRVENGLVQRNWEGLARSGDHPQAYYPNGLLSIIALKSFKDVGHAYTEKTAPFITAWPESLDIDEPEDLELANRLAPCVLGQEHSRKHRGRP